MKLPRPGRADLVRALALGKEQRDAIATILGYACELAPEGQPASEGETAKSNTERESPEKKEIGVQKAIQRTRFRPTHQEFWQPVRTQFFKSDEEPAQSDSESAHAGRAGEHSDPDTAKRAIYQLLAPISEVLAQLRQLTELERTGLDPDIPAIVDDMSRGRLRSHIPRRKRRGLGSRLHILQDRSAHLTPYDTDHAVLTAEMKDRCSATGLTVSTVRDGDMHPIMHWPPHSEILEELSPEAESTILALTDLGVLHTNSRPLMDAWVRYGEILANRNVQRVALVPVGSEAIPDELKQCWKVIPWQSSQRRAERSREQQSSDATQLLALLSFAVVIEPYLLRIARCSIPELVAYPEIESMVWQHEALAGATRGGVAIAATHREHLETLRKNWSLEQRSRVITHSIAEHASKYAGLRHTEVLNVGREYFSEHQISTARKWFEELDETGLPPEERLARIEFSRSIAPYCNSGALERCPALRLIWEQQFDRTKPENRRIAIRQGAQGLILSSQEELSAEHGESFIAEIHAKNGHLEISSSDRLEETFDIEKDFWASGEKPSWAQHWGIDNFGAWVELELPQRNPDGTKKPPAIQRLRWIPAGKFLMGSPDDEPGRYSDEGPQHEITISEGFWMCDVPCTQSIYQHVVGNNPSRFQSPNRPVENVSWNDAQEFLQAVRQLVPDLNIALPTEAEWEYACRAGTSDALYSGPIEILGSNNAPALDAIAWYAGNCGVHFDLESGVDASWGEKQYEFATGGTREVGKKNANPWGLFDMLGNVREWCRDTSDSAAYSRGDSTDPVVESKENSADRVIRGGSWTSYAQDVRAAYRVWDSPGDRYYSLGFRCRVRGAEPGQAAAEQAFPVGERDASSEAVSTRSERSRGDSSPACEERSSEPNSVAKETAWTRMLDRSETTLPVPQGPLAHIISDSQKLTLRRSARPKWAHAMGRDQYGLWADLELREWFSIPPQLTSRTSPSSGQIRLRWIPPGRFLMGAPKDESGRWDGEFEPHMVAIADGFWLFETPVTQVTWETVMGVEANESEFRSPNRPVERVSWNRCREFCAEFSSRTGLDVQLPREAEWEYACRAGTTDATYVGPIDILGDANAPILDDIAWYGGNSNIGFDLENGQDSSEWLEDRQHGDQGGTSGTHPVAQKAPNAWGLHDMLGNVFEWCEDIGHKPNETPEESSANRVIRGGSWDSGAQYVRAAYRCWSSPEDRSSYLGFRCRVREFQ